MLLRIYAIWIRETIISILNCNLYANYRIGFKQSLLVQWWVFPPVTRATGVQFPDRELSFFAENVTSFFFSSSIYLIYWIKKNNSNTGTSFLAFYEHFGEIKKNWINNVWKKFKGSTEIRTQVSGFKVPRDNQLHYRAKFEVSQRNLTLILLNERTFSFCNEAE